MLMFDLFAWFALQRFVCLSFLPECLWIWIWVLEGLASLASTSFFQTCLAPLHQPTSGHLRFQKGPVKSQPGTEAGPRKALWRDGELRKLCASAEVGTLLLVASLFLVARMLLVVRPGAPSSFLFLISPLPPP